MPDVDGRAMRLVHPDVARRRFARAILERHADREYFYLDLAVNAPDDTSSRVLESFADDAYRDATAIAKEHDLPF